VQETNTKVLYVKQNLVYQTLKLAQSKKWTFGTVFAKIKVSRLASGTGKQVCELA